MSHSLTRYLKGYVRIRISGSSPERFLNLCSFHKIHIRGLRSVGGCYEMELYLDDFRRIRPYARKTHTKVSILQKSGLPFFLYRHRNRRVFAAGIVLCILCIKLYSVFIWDIHFEGNEKWTDDALIRSLEEMEVKPGMLKSKLDCFEISESLRKQYQDIVWVSASVDGTRLKIQIKENEDPLFEVRESEEGAADLIASADGTITEIVTRSGVPVVHKGDAVKKGDLLVSGRIEVMNDSGEVSGYEYVKADADVRANTELKYSDSMDTVYEEKAYQKKRRYRVFLDLWGSRISLGTLRHSFPHSEYFRETFPVTLGENFRLPLSFGIETEQCYEIRKKRYEKEEIRSRLSSRFKQFCSELEEKGIQILGNSVKIQLDKNSAAASGTVYVNCVITEEVPADIITMERKEPDESVGTDN